MRLVFLKAYKSKNKYSFFSARYLFYGYRAAAFN